MKQAIIGHTKLSYYHSNPTRFFIKGTEEEEGEIEPKITKK